MQKDLSGYRKTYEKSALLEDYISDNPMQLFQTWFYEVEESNGIDEPNAMTVSTVGLDGFPKSRVVLLKKYTHEGFVFYTNYNSEKGKAIQENSKVCISFFWPNLERQVIIKGNAEKLAKNLSDGYFESRPDGSKLGALVSDQSSVITSREVLESKLQELEKEYAGKEISRPEHWGGYLVRPVSIEFWQGRPNRLHDRIRYSLINGVDWKMERLAP
ncbi:pyridoxamine 5'-phosphate oxidase [Maribacter confluentis]|uniref:Pyridoxine/pyridoxamine 5'-phosphate oxidase n=2 Tax=Maribacter TaxID=252356 RepID=A0ABY1SET0_9FLAO|nr:MULTISPECIES: pyridoxamine 5'-phosphate oxidase [Maribacter]MDO1511721.1 pyridoxamine 5'-phosphate oxidase [Maribacter confluentis]TVZ14984.1 pyridoxamine 5'-phosphate oxidase [Maribacter sp. MAR_2009_72]SNR38929.1 Pyridoxamine 5'-phosphate oxidase [Maribacter sedimenticola]